MDWQKLRGYCICVLAAVTVQQQLPCHSQTQEAEMPKREKVFYLKIEPRLYNSGSNLETYGGVIRLGATMKAPNNTTIFEIGPQALSYNNQPVKSLDTVLASYWSINKAIEIYGEWNNSWIDGYGNQSFYNTAKVGSVLRFNGGAVDVNQFSGLASLSKGHYLKVEQQGSTIGNFSWTGNRSIARLGWASRGKRWSLALEAGFAFTHDIYNGERYSPSGLFQLNYDLTRTQQLFVSYYPELKPFITGPMRGEFSLSFVQRF
ncbi:MAG: hypothetical protein RLZZ32_269 [Cyanobacteriota bacterium]